jgi:SNF2 family DNA or RNA helicase
MTRVLDLIQELLEWRGLSGSPDHPAVCRLDGATITADRGDLVTAFNKPGVTSGVK